MFRLEDTTLIFENDNMSIDCSPEYPELLKGEEIGKEGSFDSAPSNGEFSFDWNEKFISFTCAKRGDGLGGNLRIEIKSTPEILDSLIRCLRELKEREEEEY